MRFIFSENISCYCFFPRALVCVRRLDLAFHWRQHRAFLFCFLPAADRKRLMNAHEMRSVASKCRMLHDSRLIAHGTRPPVPIKLWGSLFTKLEMLTPENTSRIPGIARIAIFSSAMPLHSPIPTSLRAGRSLSFLFLWFSFTSIYRSGLTIEECAKASNILREFTIPSASSGPDSLIPKSVIAASRGLGISLSILFSQSFSHPIRL